VGPQLFATLSGPPHFEPVRNGTIPFDIEISRSAPSSFNIFF